MAKAVIMYFDYIIIFYFFLGGDGVGGFQWFNKHDGFCVAFALTCLMHAKSSGAS